MAIIDWYSRYVLNWALSTTLEAGFCIQIKYFFDDILPEIAASLDDRINDNFQVLNPAS
jgi:hypothetical protein